MGHLTGLLEKIQPAVDKIESSGLNLNFDDMVEEVARENVHQQMNDILYRSSILRGLFQEGKIGIAGGMYSVETGEVEFFEEKFNLAGKKEILVLEELEV